MEQDAFWRGHVEAWRRHPGLQRDYCRQHGIDARTLRKWRTRFHGPVRQPAAGPAALIEPEPAVGGLAGAAPEDAKRPAARDAGALVRRRWTAEQKRRLVWEGLNSGKPLAWFARQRGIHPSVVHRWLKAFARPALAAGPAAPPPSAAVRVAEAPAPVPGTAPGSRYGMIEIELAGGRRIRVGFDVDADALRRVVAVLDRPA